MKQPGVLGGGHIADGVGVQDAGRRAHSPGARILPHR